MNLAEIEVAVQGLDIGVGRGLIFDLLSAYGIPKASISRLRGGEYNTSAREGEVLWKGKVLDVFVDDGSDLHMVISRASEEDRVATHRPRFIVVRSDSELVALDTVTGETLDIPLSRLSSNAAFFMPWAGFEKQQLASSHYADVKAAREMGKLYDEIVATGDIHDLADVTALNTFFARLLFCFFAEDTGVFAEGSFTNAVGSLTVEDGSDTANFLDRLFDVLDTPENERDGVPSHLRIFGYVNGNLFSRSAASPRFSRKARQILLQSGELDWSEINPDIFGSMIQAVAHPDQRESLGMHYTTVENIMKVLRPLFLDDLHDRFTNATTVAKLTALRDELSKIRVFDPACGSGNFLITAYKELRRLEHHVFQRIAELSVDQPAFEMTGVKLDNFYGIEIDEFAKEMAELSLWFAKHQMNSEFKSLFGHDIPLIPLKEPAHIVLGNATRIEWADVCPPTEETFVCGNPPYHGGKKQTPSEKADVANFFAGHRPPGDLDYVGLWFLAASQYLRAGGAAVGFVTTNSIHQGGQVPLLWKRLFAEGISIAFAEPSFSWANNAPGSAGVTVSVIGLRHNASPPYRFVHNGTLRLVPAINAYLVASPNLTIVDQARRGLTSRPSLAFGNMPRAKGLVLSHEQRDELIGANPDARQFVRPYPGSEELINGKPRFCIWITDDKVDEAFAIPEIRQILEGVATERAASKAGSTKQFALEPHRFVQRPHEELPAIAIPRVSSARREYVPIGFLEPTTIASDRLFVAYGADAWLFTILHSAMHMAWLATVGGRHGSGNDFSYSNTVVYNTFPLPQLTSTTEQALTDLAFEILDTREQFPGASLAQLYDPDNMPDALRTVHRRVDEYVDSLYSNRKFGSAEERMAVLLDMYSELVAEKESQ